MSEITALRDRIEAERAYIFDNLCEPPIADCRCLDCRSIMAMDADLELLKWLAFGRIGAAWLDTPMSHPAARNLLARYPEVNHD
jgi:hypothetical protein